MSEPTRYPVPSARAHADATIERSRFRCDIARASSSAEAQAFVREIASASPEATHHCWAFVAGPPGSTTHIGMSDDGEPHGTAGRPMLTVLLHSGIGEIVAVVTRHYGGTKLGTGGLARAYASTTQLALQALTTAEKVDVAPLAVIVTYPQLSAARHLLPAFDARVTAEAYGEAVRLDLLVPRQHLDALCAALQNATSGLATFPDPADATD